MQADDDWKEALAAKLLAMGDDELILGHRDSEWCGHAPILEEDIAFANIALDEIGHAMIWYGLHAEIIGEDRETYPDRLTYWREASEWRCARLVELPKGDWAFTMVRQFLYDTYEAVMLKQLAGGAYAPLAEAAAKIRKEEIYHLRHTRAWARRLGLGTEESCRRMQIALDAVWPAALQLFEPMGGDEALIQDGIVPELSEVRSAWEGDIRPWLTDSGLIVPGTMPVTGGRNQHTEHLAPLLEDLQQVARQHPPTVKW